MNSINNQEYQSSVMIKNLPVELLESILDYLNVRDLLNLRRVSKSFKNLVEQFRIREVAFNLVSGYSQFQWKFTKKPINRSSISYGLNLFILQRSFINFRYLTHLSIRTFEIRTAIIFNHLNEFSNLKSLQIDFKVDVDTNDNQKLFLPNLEVFVFNSHYWDFGNLELDLPKCKKLHLKCTLNTLKFNHPSSITHFFNRQSDEMIYGLTNLKYYACNALDSEILSTLLSNSPNLSIIDSACLKSFDLIFQTKSILKPDLKIYYRGFELGNENDYNQYSTDSRKIVNCNDYNGYCWNDFENFSYQFLIYQSIPNFGFDNFLEKYWNIEQIHVSRRIEDQSQLVKFINKCSCLQSLVFENSMLPQTFFNLLPSISSLLELTIKDDEVRTLDPHFILRMFHLREFRTTNELIMDEQLNLNRLLDKNMIKFRIGNQSIDICKSRKDCYGFAHPSNSKTPKRLYVNLKKLVKLIHNLIQTRTNARVMTRSMYRALNDLSEQEAKKQRLV